MRTLLRIACAVVALPFASPALAAWPADPATNVALCQAPNGQQFPVAVADGRAPAQGGSGAIVAWLDLRGGANFDIYAQRVLASGAVDAAWPANGRALCTRPGDQQYPAITSDGAAGAIVVWCDARGLTSFDLFAQHVLASGVVDPAWPADGLAVSAAPGGQWFPSIVSDGAGGAIVAWHDWRNSQNDIYAQRVLAAGVVDPAWPADGLVVCAAPGNQEDVRLVADDNAGAILVWSDARGGVNTDVYAQRVLAAGVVDPAWPADGRALCTAPGNQVRPRLVADGVSGAIVTWADARNGAEYDVYAQRLLASGAVDPAWPADGRALCVAPHNQTEPVIAPDGASGAIVVWTDYRGAASDVYAQRVRASGAVDPAWPADGRALSAAVEDQYLPDVVADGAGGAIAAWTDRRGGATHDLYAQHVLASGALDPAWPAEGRAVSTAPGDQQYPTIAAAPAGVGSGSAPIVVWDDNRSGDFDIYAQLATPVVTPGSPEPVLFAVKDVKPDEGGFVTLSWNASGIDVAPTFGVTDYLIWRAAPASGSDWQVVATFPAAAQLGYSLVVPTVDDSTAAGPALHCFVVEARGDTLVPSQRWPSAPDSGYSVDDRVPVAPAGLAGDFTAGTTSLHWHPNPEPDLAGYRLYRSFWADFTPGAANLVVETADTAYADPAGQPFIYKLSAVDAHGNESPHATHLPGGTVGIAGAAPSSAFLELGGAHPIRGATALRFGIATRGPVWLALYDVGGRRLCTLARGTFAAGEHALAWDGRDEAGRTVPAGLYFVRLEAGAFAATQRIVRTQ